MLDEAFEKEKEDALTFAVNTMQYWASQNSDSQTALMAIPILIDRLLDICNATKIIRSGYMERLADVVNGYEDQPTKH